MHAFYNQVRPLLDTPLDDRLDPDRDLRSLRPVTENDRLFFGHRHPYVLRLYLVGALVERWEKIRAYGVPQDLADGVSSDHTLNVQSTGDVGGECARPDPGRPPDEHHDRLGGLTQDPPLI